MRNCFVGDDDDDGPLELLGPVPAWATCASVQVDLLFCTCVCVSLSLLIDTELSSLSTVPHAYSSLC